MNNDSKVLLDSLLETASNKWKIDGKPMDIKQIMENMNKIAFHESKSNPSAIQISDKTESGFGPGRGLFQFETGEGQGANTAINRLIAQNQGVAPSFLEGISESDYDVSSLNPEQQQAIFLGNLLQMPNVKGKMPASFMGVDTDKELADYWAQHHHAGTKVDSDDYGKMVNKFLSDIALYGG